MANVVMLVHLGAIRRDLSSPFLWSGPSFDTLDEIGSP